MNMHKAFKYRLKPTEKQVADLKQIGGGCRWLWNTMLAANQAKYADEKKFIFKHEMIVSLPQLKKDHPWLADLPSQSLQQRCWDLDTAMKRCFKSGFGFPRFKRKEDENDTFRIPQTNGHIQLSKNAIKLPKLGWIKWKQHRPTEGRLMSITVKQEGVHWYVVCLCELPDIEPITDTTEEDICGIDVGLKTFAVTSDGEMFDAFKLSLKRLKSAQRKLSRIDLLNKKNQIKKSNRRKKQKQKLRKLHAHVKNQRYDFHHKTSRQIANAYSFVGMEDLNIKGMMKNHCLADAIAKQGWSQFRSMIEYKLASKGGKLLLVDRFYPSSKTCSNCGHKQDMPLDKRVYECGSCGMVMDRDANAAMNLKKLAVNEINRAGTVRIYARGDSSNGQLGMSGCSYESMNREKIQVNDLEAHASLGRG
jgi:putative transposase